MDREPLKTFIKQYNALSTFELDNFCKIIVLNLQAVLDKDAVTLLELRPFHLSKAIINTVRKIISDTPADYLLNFSALDPNGLNRLSEMVCISLEEVQDREGRTEPLIIRDYVLMHAMTDAVRRLRIELAKDHIEQVTHQLEEVHKDTGTPFPLNDSATVYRMPRCSKAANS